MKHLKLFEYYKEDLYTEIEPQDFHDLILASESVVEEFTKTEFERIDRLMRPLYNGDYDCVLHRLITTSGKIFERSAIYIGSNEDMIIFKLRDDWYIVHSEITDYKCDQFDGLEQCLKDIEF
jgi:hypothetical protein